MQTTLFAGLAYEFVPTSNQEMAEIDALLAAL